jgi:hypothetical protein
MGNNIYIKHGFKSRNDYLLDLADSYGVEPEKVFQLANMLGETEDFDGLVTAIQDMDWDMKGYDDNWDDE